MGLSADPGIDMSPIAAVMAAGTVVAEAEEFIRAESDFPRPCFHCNRAVSLADASTARATAIADIGGVVQIAVDAHVMKDNR